MYRSGLGDFFLGSVFERLQSILATRVYSERWLCQTFSVSKTLLDRTVAFVPLPRAQSPKQRWKIRCLCHSKQLGEKNGWSGQEDPCTSALRLNSHQVSGQIQISYSCQIWVVLTWNLYRIYTCQKIKRLSVLLQALVHLVQPGLLN